MNADESEQLRDVASDVREIKQAVLGDQKIGLPGLVNDVRTLKQWRARVDLRVATIAGGVSAVVILAKWLLTVMY